MVRGKKTKGLVIVLFLLMTTSLNASLINSIGGKQYPLCLDSKIYSESEYSNKRTIFTGPYSSEYSNTYEEYNSKSVNYLFNSPLNVQGEALPPVPRTLVMVICGFICVSIIKDRKFWFRVLTGIIRTVHSGLSFFPYIASYLISRDHIRGKNEDVYDESCYQENGWYLQKDSKNKRYIGLLRRLAGIPKHINVDNLDTTNFGKLKQHKTFLYKCYFCSYDSHKYDNSIRSYQKKNANLVPLSSILAICSAFKNKRNAGNSTIIIFACLARGPP